MVGQIEPAISWQTLAQRKVDTLEVAATGKDEGMTLQTRGLRRVETIQEVTIYTLERGKLDVASLITNSTIQVDA